jgi:hypothetical protein
VVVFDASRLIPAAYAPCTGKPGEKKKKKKATLHKRIRELNVPVSDRFRDW